MERERERCTVACQYRFISSALIHPQQKSTHQYILPLHRTHTACLYASLLAPAGGRLAACAAVGERWGGMRAPRPPGDDLVLAAVLEAVGR